MNMKEIVFSKHSLDQMRDRGTDEAEVKETIYTGENLTAKKGRIAFRKNFKYNGVWNKKNYKIKQVKPIVLEYPDKFVVITVYVYYFGGD